MRSPTLRPFRHSLAACLLLPLAHAGNVIIVDSFGGGPFAAIQPAVDIAVDGDVILVRGGSYTTFLIDGKAIDVVADLDANVFVSGAPRVANVPAGKRVLLAGLEITGIAGPTLFGGHGLNVINCAGAVRIEKCMLTAADNTYLDPNCSGWGDTSGWEGAVVLNSADVAFEHCTLRGGRGMYLQDALGCPKVTPGGEGGHAIRVANSKLVMHESDLQAGDGGLGGNGGEGGDGIHCSDTPVFVSGSSVRAGKGGKGIDWLFGPGGDGGHGFDMLEGGASATLLETTVVAGLHGAGFTGPGADGLPFGGGSATVYPGFARSLAVAGPAREGASAQVQLAGQPFDLAIALIGPIDVQLALPQYSGVLLTSSQTIVSLGSLGPTGAKSLAIPIALMPPFDLSAVVPVQGLFISTSLEIVLGSGAHQVLLDVSL